jgi:hypothetical protein
MAKRGEDIPMEGMQGPFRFDYRYKIFEATTGKLVSQHFSLTSAEKTYARFKRQDVRARKNTSYYIWDDHDQMKLREE